MDPVQEGNTSGKKRMKAGSGSRSALEKQLDPDPHGESQLDPDPQKNECGSTALWYAVLMGKSCSRVVFCGVSISGFCWRVKQ